MGIRIVIVQCKDVNSVSSSTKWLNCCRSGLRGKAAARRQPGVPIRRSKRLQGQQQPSVPVRRSQRLQEQQQHISSKGAPL